MKPDVLLAVPTQAGLPPLAGFQLLEEEFTVHHAPNRAAVNELIPKVGSRIRAAVCSNSIGLNDEQIRALPKLEFIQTRGAGFENYGMNAIRERGIILANSRNVNPFSVGEHTMALLLMLVRDLKTADAEIRAGRYVESRARPPRPLIYERTMGIFGLGDVGREIAKRAVPFEVKVIYHNRKPRTDVPYQYVGSLGELAAASDILVVAVPGGPDTRGMVNAAVLKALGPEGFLVNVGRGSVVDTNDLVKALNDRTIAGAALDVIDGEPNIPQALLDAPNVILSPHLGSSSIQARMNGVRNAHDSLKAFFAGEPVKNRIL